MTDKEELKQLDDDLAFEGGRRAYDEYRVAGPYAAMPQAPYLSGSKKRFWLKGFQYSRDNGPPEETRPVAKIDTSSQVYKVQRPMGRGPIIVYNEDQSLQFSITAPGSDLWNMLGTDLKMYVQAEIRSDGEFIVTEKLGEQGW